MTPSPRPICWPTSCPRSPTRARVRATTAAMYTNSGAGGGAGAPESPPPAGMPGGLRRLGLRHGPLVGQAGNRGRADLYEGAAAERAGWAVRQGPLHHRPDHGHRHLPRPGERADPPGQGWRRGIAGTSAPPAPVARWPRMHYLTRWPHHHDQCVRATARPSPRRPGRSAWVDEYKATRPKVERKIGHLMRRRHGGRRARVRGIGKVAADFSLLAAAVNLARLGALGMHRSRRPRLASRAGMTAKRLPHSRFRTDPDKARSNGQGTPTDRTRHRPTPAVTASSTVRAG